MNINKLIAKLLMSVWHRSGYYTFHKDEFKIHIDVYSDELLLETHIIHNNTKYINITKINIRNKHHGFVYSEIINLINKLRLLNK